MKCPRCQAEQAIGTKYCGACGYGARLSSCPQCGTSNPETNRFCHECGRALAADPPGSRREPPEPLPEEGEGSAFWEAYADRIGLPRPGLIDLTRVPDVPRQESLLEDRERRHAARPPGRQEFARPAPARDLERAGRRGRALPAALRDDRERGAFRIMAFVAAIVALILTGLLLSPRPWPAALRPDGLDSLARRLSRSFGLAPAPTASVGSPAEPDPAAVGPVNPEMRTASEQDLTSTGDAGASPSSSPLLQAARQEEIALSRQPRPDGPPPAPRQAPAPPGTSAERMAAFLIERDGPERSLQTALAVAQFYRVDTDTFTYWQRVAAAIRASTSRKPGSGATESEVIQDAPAQR